GTVDRTTNGSLAIKDLNYDEYISTLDAGNGEKVPLLEEVLKLCKKNSVLLNIEIKSAGLEKMIIDLVNSLDYRENVIISSFHHEFLKTIKKLEPKIKTAALVPTSARGFIKKILGKALNKNQQDLIDAALKANTDAINPFHGTCTNNFFKACKENKLEIFPWTIDSISTARKLAKWGATGIITNDPASLIKAGLKNE
ncbi:MAG: glycerophosphodiester phosphodiesterase, partial [Promethearchaeota archaeon]